MKYLHHSWSNKHIFCKADCSDLITDFVPMGREAFYVYIPYVYVNEDHRQTCFYIYMDMWWWYNNMLITVCDVSSSFYDNAECSSMWQETNHISDYMWQV